MRISGIVFLLAAVACVSAQAAPICVDPEQPALSREARTTGSGGIGGTGAPQSTTAVGSTGGIGGTGQIASPGGIGGTGAPNEGVGIVGIVTGFASVCVNGVEVHFEAATPTSENGAASHPAALAVGQLVSIEAVAGPHGLVARGIAIVNALEGPITRLPKGGKFIEVLGQTVALMPDTRGLSGKGLAPGQMVKVAGLVGADGKLTATRLTAAPGLTRSSVVGAVGGKGPASHVGGVAVNTHVVRVVRW